jgi:molybdate transport system substrate-binding protein
MRELAASEARRPIGCTQSTEIISTKGVSLSGSLPPGCELATMYTAGITIAAAHPQQVQCLIDLLTGAGQHEQRKRAGFISGRRPT